VILKNRDQGKISVKSKTLVVAASGICSIILLVWLLDSKLGNTLKTFLPLTSSQPSQTTSQKPVKSLSSSTPSDDPFAASVRLANQASVAGKTATTSTQWLSLAAKWQRASDLMAQVSPSHSRYQEAQIRTKLYKKFSEAAQEEAEKSNS
jgi:hypothetical protein